MESKPAENFGGDDVDWQLNADKGRNTFDDDGVNEDNMQKEKEKETDANVSSNVFIQPKRKARLRVDGKINDYFCN